MYKRQVHMLVSIPPKYSVSQFMGYLKGKSALMIFDKHANLNYKFGNRHFWSEGYYVSTVAVSYTHLIIDIDRNPENPITNVRTYGSDPERILRMAKAYIDACRERKFISTIKHFPGDGVDYRDQHLMSSVNSLSVEEMCIRDSPMPHLVLLYSILTF